MTSDEILLYLLNVFFKNNETMKTKIMNRIFFLRAITTLFLIISIGMISGCDNDDPKKEDTPELITKVTLTFTPSAGGPPVIATATDPDGAGVQNIAADAPINLAANKSYTLTVQLINGLAQPTDPAYNITGEVEAEADEHMLFFSWTNNVFNDPTGNGNIDSRSDDVNYEDTDAHGLPLGLETFWTTSGASSGKFRILLKHQPGLKTSTSASTAGETDLDIEFTINVQ